MKTRDFYFDLPQELIAQYPAARRGEERLMRVERKTGKITHHMMRELPFLLPPRCVAVFNNSRVRKARLYAESGETGSRVEFLLLSTRNRRDWAFLSNKTRRARPGKIFRFPEGVTASVEAPGSAETASGAVLRFSRPVTEDYLERYGHVPLPPYIRRRDEAADEERYQTVYAGPIGSAAAPTAGLHFTPALLADMEAAGVTQVMVSLHVGLGTFLPVRADNIEEHLMHGEEFFISEEAARMLGAAKELGRPLLAVGTTSVRVLETAWDTQTRALKAGGGATRIFIYPGYAFKAVDLLFTNFHTPESTLLMLVCAFAGRDLIFKAYAEAMREKYRFFSYGDAMLVM
jgi:S-adenosylmethionine:tRNA ribosyltransferase-isomerase